MRTRNVLAALAIPTMLMAPAAPAAQGSYPDKPIRLIIGSAPGSGPDIIARLTADHLYGVWGQRVVVDSRAGVAGILSAEQALRANADGYTWMVLTSQLFVATSLYPDKDALDDLGREVRPVHSYNPLVQIEATAPQAEESRL